MPINGNFIVGNKNTLGGYEYINGYNTINNNGAADYRAGKEIALLPPSPIYGGTGFSSVLGSDFHAYISPYKCSNGQYNGEMLKQPNIAPEYDEAVPEQISSSTNTNQVTNANPNFDDLLTNFKSQLDSIIIIPDYILRPLESKIEIYPNPNNGKFNIAFNLTNSDNINLQIFDMIGREVYSEKFITGFFVLPLNLNHLSKGMYMAKFNDSTGEIVSKKITID
jgi:hypothetical protein